MSQEQDQQARGGRSDGLVALSHRGKLAAVLSFAIPGLVVLGILYLMVAMREGAESAMARLSFLLPVGYAFSAGMVATVNPCGFMLLPTYILYHLGADEDSFQQQRTASRLTRALYLGLTATGGFVVVFAVAGALVATGGSWLNSVFPVARLVIGIGLFGLGMWLLITGRSLGLQVASRVTITPQRNIGNVFLFGIVYAVSSLSCTLPVFLVVLGSALASPSWLDILSQFVSYALGMGLVFVAVTIGAAILRHAATRKLQGAVLYVKRFSALLLVGVGGYLAYDWIASTMV
jgi:cytochrome c biogenesis protein CcdA